MTEAETALWWARARAEGPPRVAPSSAAPAGMLRLVEPDASGVWLLPLLPDGARPSVAEELGQPPVLIEQPNDTARVLAACLRCCWADPSGAIWPGVTASKDQVASVFQRITSRDEVASNRALVAALRRLSVAGWLLWEPSTQTVRLGPRVAAWGSAELSTLRELWRMMPAPTEGAT